MKRTGPEARILHIRIDVPFDRAYAFAHRPENFPQWAAGLADTLRETAAGWIAGTPDGDVAVRFSPPNDRGVLDHWVRIGDAPEIAVPLRMVPDGAATEVSLTLFRQPGMSAAAFARDARLVRRDLAALKALLEGLRPPEPRSP